MKNIHFPDDTISHKKFIKKFGENIEKAKEYSETMEYSNEALLFSKYNAQIVLMYMKRAEEEIRKNRIRSGVYRWAEEIIDGGKASLTKEDLFEKINMLDEEINLRTVEYFSLSNILIIQSAFIFNDALESSINVQKERLQAENWITGDEKHKCSDRLFFLEHALKLSRDTMDEEKRREIEKTLEYIGKTEEDMVEIASRSISDLLLRLTNAINLVHLSVNTDWMAAYKKLSRTEKLLISDPGNIYPQMDDESKSIVRKSLEEISIYSGFSENTIVSKAIELVREGVFSNICQALYTDAGRQSILEKVKSGRTGIRKIIPDPNGVRIISVQLITTAAIFILLMTFMPFPFPVFILPLIWSAVMDITRFLASKRWSPHPLLALEIDSVSEENRTLVVVPALLTSAEASKDVLLRLWEHGVHENDQNIDFLLLGDFKDSEKETLDTDFQIKKTVTDQIRDMNREAGREKYFYLQRSRSFNEKDGKWMGRERKRGAIEDLNRLIITGKNRFDCEKEEADYFVHRYSYLLTMDSDTRILPGEIRKLIGMISHPLNRGYGVIQPRMETIPSEKENIFSKWFSGIGGTDHYDVCASDYYQDLTGEGLFSGKGILNIRKFYEATCEAFRENTVLSHDMIEGILAKAAFAGNRAMFESFPETIGSYLKRLDRWTRGDWQLVYYLFGRIKLSALARFKIVSNLMRSLKSASVVLCLAASFWSGSGMVLALTICAQFLPVFLYGFSAVKPSAMSFLLLPCAAYTELRAASTALFRLFITRKKCLEWVTASEIVTDTKGKNLPGIFASLLMLPGLFVPQKAFFALIIAISFSFGRSAIEYLQKIRSDDSLSTDNYGYLSELSRSIWKYFEKYVPVSGNGLPPDNVQLDPAVGVQKRTSPTNIGMYMLSSIGATKLGLIPKEEAIKRLQNTLVSLEKLEKHNGLFYNWYDIDSLLPVYPRYISSVDLGNLMAACVTARNFLSQDEQTLAERFQSLIDSMDIFFLYNERRKLFRIGYDVENQRQSESHYDLFASEARILSYTVMAEKGITISHWKRLARPFSYIRNKPVILSWSGTMFEYMMPNLIMPSTDGSLVKNMEKAVIFEQKRNARNSVWGISESGYQAFDRDLNYQYQAFGISSLALSGNENGRVYSPYSVILALEHAKDSGVETLINMQRLGLKGEYGFYESIDLTKEDKPQIVYSYMTHHQGMSFVSCVNILTGNSMKKLFMSHPKESALKPLLSEKPFVASAAKIIQKKIKKHPEYTKENVLSKKYGEYTRIGNERLDEGHILFSGNALAYFEPSGRSFLRSGGIYANHWSFDASEIKESLLPSIIDESGEAKIEKAIFDTGYTKYEMSSGMIDAVVTFTINPENGRLLIKNEISTRCKGETDVTVVHDFRLALSDEDTINAHPVFSDLFIREDVIDNYGKIYRKKNRESLKEDVCLIHTTDKAISDDVKMPTSHEKRTRIKRKITVAPGEKSEIYFEIGIAKELSKNPAAPEKSTFERSIILLRSQMNAHIAFCGLRRTEYRNVDRSTFRLFSFRAKTGTSGIRPESLWQLGISGEKPILLSYVTQKTSLLPLKKLIRAHEFYRYGGIDSDIVILKIREADYFTPLADSINRILSASHMGHKKESLIHSMDGISGEQTEALNSLSVISVKNDFLKDSTAKMKEAAPESICRYSDIMELPVNENLYSYNGYGGFQAEEAGYEIYIGNASLPPRRWSNFLANADFGAVTTDLGIMNLYFSNSRSGQITPFENNLDFPPLGIALTASENGKKLLLTPGEKPMGAYKVVFKPGMTTYTVETKSVKYQTKCFVDDERPVFFAVIDIEKKTDEPIEVEAEAAVRFLMGTDKRDLRFTRMERCARFIQAGGKCGFNAYAGFCGKDSYDSGQRLTIQMDKEKRKRVSYVVCASEKCFYDIQNESDVNQAEDNVKKRIQKCFGSIKVNTNNPPRDLLINSFMKAQTLFSRFYARFGPYQPGGAFGMRDQLQDLLSIMYFEPGLARNHLLLCASRQFEKGDALHWWHMPGKGVRTRISDDILFLPLITSKYIRLTGDHSILYEPIPFLKDVPIPEGQDDLYMAFEETNEKATLYEHIMRAFRHVSRKGDHNLILMGTGDWNDGMNRIGINGKGESVWLSEFFLYTANEFMPFANEEDRKTLKYECEIIKNAIETHAWDGKWYLRAFDDGGNKIGSYENEECRIDLITQAWAVIAGLDEKRAKQAVQSCLDLLYDKKEGIIRLLSSPFTGRTCHPGYIAAYPKGIRENGGQYTHAACWLVKALAMLEMADEAWEAYDMLLPVSRTDTKAKADKYKGEPFVISADISYNETKMGECGWTWYTGAAAWAERILIEDLLGVEIKNDDVTMNALLPSGTDQMSVEIHKGSSVYILTSGRNSKEKRRFVRLIDDGLTHKIEFPIRNQENAQ